MPSVRAGVNIKTRPLGGGGAPGPAVPCSTYTLIRVYRGSYAPGTRPAALTLPTVRGRRGRDMVAWGGLVGREQSLGPGSGHFG